MPASSLPRPYIILTLFVCISAAAIGAYFGNMYEREVPAAGIGTATAAVGGALLGLFWSYMMFRHTRKGCKSLVIIAMGVLWGLAAGLLDTLLLHLVMYIQVPSEISGMAFSEGLIYGVESGLINGLICGAIWNDLASKTNSRLRCHITTMGRLIHQPPYLMLTLFACFFAAIMSGSFVYARDVLASDLSVPIAAISGVFVGLFWSYMMLRSIRKGNKGIELIGLGIFWSFVAGLINTFILNITMDILELILMWPEDFSGFLVLGVVPIVLHGLICSVVWTAAANKYPLVMPQE